MQPYFYKIIFLYLCFDICATVQLPENKEMQQKKTGRKNEEDNTGPDNISTQITPMDVQKFDAESHDTTFEHKKPPKESLQIINAYNIREQLQIIIDSLPFINATTEVIGKTLGYNDIVLLKITQYDVSNFKKRFRAEENKFTDEKPEKKIIFIVHGLSVMGAQFLPCFRRLHHFKLLLSFYFEHLDKFDIFLIPMANPDGFAYIMNSALRLWNKNLTPQSQCRGIALDRNFDVAWNSTKPVNSCSNQYPGTTPFSEEETKAVREVFQRYSHKIIAYIHVHGGTFTEDTYKGEAVLYPRGYTEVTTDDDKYIDLRGEIEEVIREHFDTLTVSVDTLYAWYGKIFGSSVDYAATIYGIPYAMEFSMQVYETNIVSSDEVETTFSENLLKEVWQRVINVTFNNIWRSLNIADN